MYKTPYPCSNGSNRNTPIRVEGGVFANGPGDRGSIPGRVTLKTKKMVLDTPLLNTHHYNVRIKSSGTIKGKE